MSLCGGTWGGALDAQSTIECKPAPSPAAAPPRVAASSTRFALGGAQAFPQPTHACQFASAMRFPSRLQEAVSFRLPGAVVPS